MTAFLRLSFALALVGAALPATAQPGTQPAPAGMTDRVVAGTAYFVYTEPGAPTMEVFLVRNESGGVYRVAQETTLTQLLALSGGVAPPDQITQTSIMRSVVRVLRLAGDTRSVIYEAAPDQMFREPGRHPALISGDLVEVTTTVEERPRRMTLGERLSIVSGLASLASFVAFIVQAF